MAPRLREKVVRKKGTKSVLAPSCRTTGVSKKWVIKPPPVVSSPLPHLPLEMKTNKALIVPPAKKTENTEYRFNIMALPTETHLDIVKHLDYKELLNISATNKHFRDIFLHSDKYLFKVALVKFEESSAAWQTNVTGEITYAPCYGCLKTLSKCHFRSQSWLSSSTATGARAFSRRCETCDVGYKLTGPSRVMFHRENYWMFCQGCQTLTHLSGKEACGIYDHRQNWTYEDGSQQALNPGCELCMECRSGTGTDVKTGEQSGPTTAHGMKLRPRRIRQSG